MTNERKAELFDGAMNWVYKHLAYEDEAGYEETLEEIGFTDEEIAEEMTNIFVSEDDDDYIPSSTNGDYSPSTPYNAPGMCIDDFIRGVR